ncbi:hypothetical protein F5Y08DRAFT_212190 [Xylaria arbuscula]|nr:hypothetical protein F5Y08DRAFT_212190 [Xylaria arbuscula]
MGAQHRIIPGVPNEIVLHIVEHMEPSTRINFMTTSKKINRFIVAHERSISKTQLATYTLCPVGKALSSADEERHVVEKDSFAMISELQLRRWRIDSLLSECPGLFCLVSPPSLPSLTAAGQTQLVPILRRALHQCDRIADIAADESPVCAKWYRDMRDNKCTRPYTPTLPVNPETLNPLANSKARPKQIEYIRSLSLEDATGLFILTNLVGYGMMINHLSHFAMGFEGKTCAEECVLRHGTWFIWIWFRSGRLLPGYVLNMLLTGRAELRAWESGLVNGPDGLKMTLTARLRELHGGAIGAEFHQKVEKTVRKLILGEDDSDDDEGDNEDEDGDEAEESSTDGKTEAKATIDAS